MNGVLYDVMIALGERHVLGALRRELLAPLWGDILEVGAGTGADFPYYGEQAHVIALEPDRAMAVRAQPRAQRCAATIDLCIADDTTLAQFAAASMDAVVFPLVLCSLPDPTATLMQARRILKASGTLVLLEHVRSDGMLGRIQDALTPAWRAVAGGCHLNRATRQLVHAAGFDTSALRTHRLPRLFLIRDLLFGYAYPAWEPA
ncbi:MAG: class I SAM-dependent methyltransferase [Vulcanimicrobiaceae bacterium]